MTITTAQVNDALKYLNSTFHEYRFKIKPRISTSPEYDYSSTNYVDKTMCLCPLSAVYGRNYPNVFEDAVLNGKMYDFYQRCVVSWCDENWGDDFYYWFTSGFDLIASRAMTAKKYVETKEAYKNGLLLRQEFVDG